MGRYVLLEDAIKEIETCGIPGAGYSNREREDDVIEMLKSISVDDGDSERLAAYEALEMSPVEISSCLKALDEYDAAEVQGHLFRFPCKIKDTVYWAIPGEIIEGTISMLQQRSNGSWKFRMSIKNRGFSDIEMDEIGKTVFLTREEAEKNCRN